MRYFFTADLHFGHANTIKYSNRPYQSLAEMDAALIQNINKEVGEKDTLYFLGDWCKGGEEVAGHYRKQIKCRHVHLIRGNHDRPIISKWFQSSHDQLEIGIDGQRIHLSHFPLLTWSGVEKGKWSLHGHTHANLEEWANKTFPQRTFLDVGVDNAARLLGEYKPFSLEWLAQHFKERVFNAPDIKGKIPKETWTAIRIDTKRDWTSISDENWWTDAQRKVELELCKQRKYFVCTWKDGYGISKDCGDNGLFEIYESGQPFRTATYQESVIKRNKLNG